MDRLAAMQTFVRVAESGSFTAVADQLNLARSAVTRQIASLEAHLGVKLISRSTRRLSLTQEGLSYLTQCREILDRINSAEASLSQDKNAAKGLIRATLPMSFGLRHVMPLVTEFATLHPELSIDLDFSDRRVDLVEEGFDFGLRITGQLPESQVARRLCTCRFVVAASPAYLECHGEPRHPGDLKQHQCLLYSLAMRSSWRFEVNGELQSIEVGGIFSADSGDAIQRAAIGGMGIAYQPSFLASEAIRSGELRRILADFRLPEIGIYIVFPSNRFVPQRVRQLVDFLADRLSESNGQDTRLPVWDIGIF